MTYRPSHDKEVANLVLECLGVKAGPPTRPLLEALVDAYVHTVPWESAFRIVRKANCTELASCPRWPEEFWKEHIHKGAGGSCFETNYAFFWLLNMLEYESYLTINNMGESIGCHTAIIVILNGQKWLADVGFPLYTILPLNPHGGVHRSSPVLRYTVRSKGNDRYQIERRPHPKWYAFTLIDRPVSEEQYRQATVADYGPQGHFLDRVIIHKVINKTLWRFNSGEYPHVLEYFQNGKRGVQSLGENASTVLAHKFRIDESVLCLALALIEH